MTAEVRVAARGTQPGPPARPDSGSAPEDPAAITEEAMTEEVTEARRALQESLDLRDQGHVDER